MGIRKRHILMHFLNQFNYCPLICMCCNRSLKNKLDRLHEWSLRLVHSDKTSDFSELLEKDGCLYSLPKYPTVCNWNVQGIKRFMSWNCFNLDTTYLAISHYNSTFLLYEQFLVVQRVFNILALKFGNLYQMKWKN